MSRMLDYGYIAATIALTVYGQLILKARIVAHGTLPASFGAKLLFLTSLFLDPLILSGFVAAFLASFAWMAAMTKFDLSHAYPFMSLNFVIVLLLSNWLLSEPVSMLKAAGVALIVFGTIIVSRG